MASEHLKALTPYVENGFWKLGGKVLDHFLSRLICKTFTIDMKIRSYTRRSTQGRRWPKDQRERDACIS